jgi:metallo-beta-lactamase class B
MQLSARLFLSIVAVVTALGTVTARGQSHKASVESHVSAARTAAGDDYTGLFTTLCTPPPPAPAPPAAPASAPGGTPPRAQWHAEPVKVFDNLYFVGQTEYSAWAVTTSAGIIIVDTIFGYSVEDEVVGGLKKLGLDPATIKYVIVSHGHGDHSGGAKYLQEHFGAHVLLSAADWNLLESAPEPKPKRDMVVTDGQKLTLGDTTLTLYITPGHTLGTLSTLIPVKDHGAPHLAAVWGGTNFNWLRNRSGYITPERSDRFWFDTYTASARRFRDVASRAGADVILSNHTDYDGSKRKLPQVVARADGARNPYVVGKEGVLRYLTVAEECAQAGLQRLP